jgi:hypothetical protein
MEYIYEMVYQQSRCKPQVLAHGVYHGRNYYVVSFGTHPCAYVDVSDLLSWRGNILKRRTCGSE